MARRRTIDRGTHYPPENVIGLKIDGPGVRLATINPQQALKVAVAYFDLLEEVVAEEIDEQFVLKGLRVEDNSVDFFSETEQPDFANEALHRIHEIAAGSVRVPSGLRRTWRDYRRIVSDLPTSFSVFGLLGTKSFKIRPEVERAPSDAGEVLSVRAKLIRIGGKTPRVRFNSEGEQDSLFTIDIGREVNGREVTPVEAAKDLRHHLYDELEIVARVLRNPDGRIVDGSLREFRIVDAGGNPLARLREWWRVNGKDTSDLGPDLDGLIRPHDDD